MIIYKRLKTIRAISFDLDDTLYDNGPVIQKAETAIVHYLAQKFPRTAPLGEQGWLKIKNQIGERYPALRHDVTQWRLTFIEAGLQEFGYNPEQAKAGAKEGIRYFLTVRSQVTVPQQSHQLLTNLAKRYPLVAITNGNVQLNQIGLEHYFTHTFSAGNGMQMKPAPDLFNAASQALNLPPQQILHVGDHLITDVAGANSNGFQSVWLNLSPATPAGYQQLPNVEIAELSALSLLV